MKYYTFTWIVSVYIILSKLEGINDMRTESSVTFITSVNSLLHKGGLMASICSVSLGINY